MADHLLFIGWDEVVRGREERAIEVFNEVVGYYGRLQQEGRLESFDAVFLVPTGSGLQGYFQLNGSEEQIAAVQADEEFRRRMLDAGLAVERLSIAPGYTGQAIAEQMAMYQEAISKVSQMAR